MRNKAIRRRKKLLELRMERLKRNMKTGGCHLVLSEAERFTSYDADAMVALFDSYYFTHIEKCLILDFCSISFWEAFIKSYDKQWSGKTNTTGNRAVEDEENTEEEKEQEENEEEEEDTEVEEEEEVEGEKEEEDKEEEDEDEDEEEEEDEEEDENE